MYHIPKPHKDLRDFTTTEKDMQKKQSRHPTSEYRALSEDLFALSNGAQDATNQMANMGINSVSTEGSEP